MANLIVTDDGNLLVIGALDCVLAVSLAENNGKITELSCVDVMKTQNESLSSSSNGAQNEEQKVCETSDHSTNSQTQCLCCAVVKVLDNRNADCYSYCVAAAFNNRNVVVWRLDIENNDDSQQRVCRVIKLPKQATSIIFDSDQNLIVSDRFGNVHCFKDVLSPSPSIDVADEKSISEEVESEDLISKQNGSTILGHLSMVLDLKLISIPSNSTEYLVSCDRDEKLRVSHYPNAYNIHAFCLAHRSYVRSIDVIQLDTGPLLVSLSGDCTLRLWDPIDENGACLSCFELNCDLSLSGATPRKVVCRTQQQQQSNNNNNVVLCCVLYNDRPEIQILCLDLQNDAPTKERTVNWTETQRLRLQADNNEVMGVWDAAIDEKNRLLLLPRVQTRDVKPHNCLQTFEFNVAEFTFSELTSNVPNDLLVTISKRLPFVKDELPSLDKVTCYDNMPKYLERKEERIAKKQKIG